MKSSRSFAKLSPAALLLAAVPLLTGADGKKGCGGATPEPGEQVTPDVTAEWDLEYADDLTIEITIGGAVYTDTIGLQGGTITIEHDGQPISFDLDCTRPEVVCPSEVWPESVSLDQRDESFPRNVYVTVPSSECVGQLVDPDPAQCGPGTNNEECEAVCDGEVVVTNEEKFGRITEDDQALDVFLGAGIASNGFNCALLGFSAAHADLETSGSAETGDWQADSMSNGEIATSFAGGCLWAGDPDDDGTLEALVIGAAVKLTTGFSATRR